MLSASSLIWRQAPEVHYLLCKELFFNLFSADPLLVSGNCSSVCALSAAFTICKHQSQHSLLLQNEEPEPFWCLLAGQLPHRLDRVCCVPSATRLSPTCGMETRRAHTPETRVHQGFMQQRRDTLGLALNTLPHGTQRSLALVRLLLQAKPVILERALSDGSETVCLNVPASTTFSIP